MLVYIYRVWAWTQRGLLGAKGFVPLPPFLRWYFKRLTKLRQLQVYSRLVKDVAFWKKAPADLACAESVTKIGNILFGMPVILGTWTLLEYLKRDKGWMQIDYPENGCIVIAATGTGYAGTIGHVGYYDNKRIWSNDSRTGTWRNYYSMMAFKTRYSVKQGMPIRYFVPVEL